MPANKKSRNPGCVPDSAPPGRPDAPGEGPPLCCGVPPPPTGDFASCRQLFTERAIILKAMAHPARLYIVDRLSAGECTVRELTELIDCEMPTVSRHLSVLRHARIVASRKQGSNVWYRLQVPCILNFFGCIEDVIRQGSEPDGTATGERP